jgi:two-component system cell cycle response regulator
LDERKILIVDDDPNMASIVKTALHGPGRVFLTAGDGVEAIEKVFTEMPDLVVLDVMMPKMNGYQVCRLVKNDKTTWQIPVILLTARNRDKDRLYGMSVGADEYIVKPFRSEELKLKADALLARSDSVLKTWPAEGSGKFGEAGILSRVNSLLDRKLEEMTFLQQITKSMVSTFDEEKILNTVLDGITYELGYQRAVIFLADEDGRLRGRSSVGMPMGCEGLMLEPSEKEAYAQLLRGNEQVVLRDTFLGLETELAVSLEGAPGRQQCLVPVVSREEVLGAILLFQQEGEPPFSEERIGIVVTLAGQLGLALDNAVLYQTTLQQSITDGLTGLHNTRYLYNRIEIEMSRARRYGHSLSLFMLDIDYFKHYNDRYGHLSGDDALRQIARILKENSREVDTVARYGGEEFCVILPETDGAQAKVLAERIRGAVESTPVRPGEGHQPEVLTISIGISTMTDDACVAEDLVRMADKALYRAKDEGRNRVCVF